MEPKILLVDEAQRFANNRGDNHLCERCGYNRSFSYCAVNHPYWMSPSPHASNSSTRTKKMGNIAKRKNKKKNYCRKHEKLRQGVIQSCKQCLKQLTEGAAT